MIGFITENASDGRFPVRSRIYSAVDSNTPQISRKRVPFIRSSPSDSALKTTARNRVAPEVTGKRSTPLAVSELNAKKSSDSNAAVTHLHGSSETSVDAENLIGDDEDVPRKADARSKQENKRGLFSKYPGSRVVPYPEDGSEVTGSASNASADVCRHHKDFEDLSLIRKQLVQIENQQSSLMDLLQVILGSPFVTYLLGVILSICLFCGCIRTPQTLHR